MKRAVAHTFTILFLAFSVSCSGGHGNTPDAAVPVAPKDGSVAPPVAKDGPNAMPCLFNGIIYYEGGYFRSEEHTSERV